MADIENTIEERMDLDSFFDQKMFRDFARGDGGVEILSAQEAGVESEIKTAGIDLENRTLYFNEGFIAKLDAGEKAFTVLHEGGHLKKLLELLDRPNGHNLYKSWYRETSEKRRYHLLDNCVADAGINKDVIDYAPVAETIEERLYENHLFKIEDESDVLDMREAPKHIQFSQVFPYEKEGTNRVAEVSEDVRAKIDELKAEEIFPGLSLYDYLTSAGIPEDLRIKLQRKYLCPIIDELFEEDVEDQKQKKQGENNQQQSGDSGEEQLESTSEADGDQGGDEKSEKGDQDSEGGEGDESDGSGEGNKEENPEDMFKGYYDELEKGTPHIINEEDVEEAVKDYIKQGGKGAGKSNQQILDEAMARESGVSTEDLQKYRNFWQQVEQIKNPETNEAVVEELRKMFQRIVNDRKEKKYIPKYPVKEGEILSYPAEAVVAVKSGEKEPEVWGTIEPKEKPKEMYGDFDVTIVSDRSSSMSSTEVLEQKKAVALILESLAEFNEYLDDVRVDLEYNLNIRTEAWSFGDSEQTEILKPLSEELTEKQKVNVFKKLDDASGGSTDDFVVLKKINDDISEEDMEKIKAGKMKKIIIVTSDGGSSDSKKLQKSLKELREKGVIIAAVGITNSGELVEEQYKPDGQVCEDSSKLANVLSDLLKEHLREL